MTKKRDSQKAYGPQITVSQAAERLGVSRQWVDRLIQSGKLMATWVGAYRVLSLEAVDELRDARK